MSDTIAWAISYDIAETRVRNRVSALLERHAVRVQKSVFEARMSDKAMQRLKRQLVRQMDTGDSLRIYALPVNALEQSMIHGGAPLPEEGHFWIL